MCSSAPVSPSVMIAALDAACEQRRRAALRASSTECHLHAGQHFGLGLVRRDIVAEREDAIVERARGRRIEDRRRAPRRAISSARTAASSGCSSCVTKTLAEPIRPALAIHVGRRDQSSPHPGRR